MQDFILNVEDAGAPLFENLNAMGPNDRILLYQRDKAIAEVRLLGANASKTPASNNGNSVAKRQLGLARGEFTLPESFFEPLPDDLLDAFES